MGNTSSSVQLARALELPRGEFFAEMASESMDFAGGYACFDGADSPYSYTCAAGLASPPEEAEIEALIQFYRERKAEVRVAATPYVDPSLLAALARRKFTLRAFENVWVYDLLHGPEPADGCELGPSGLSFETVSAGHARLEEFLRMSSSGLRSQTDNAGQSIEAATRRLLESKGGVGVLASLSGKVVGASAAWMGDKVAELFGTTVCPEYRRQGIQRALLHHRLALAKSQGLSLASITSAPGVPSESNVRRVGFALAYARVVLGLNAAAADGQGERTAA